MMADGSAPSVPRLIGLADARAYLGGKHPASLGCKPVGRLWDRKEIDHKLDLRAGIGLRNAPAGSAANDCTEEDELEALAKRIGDVASSREAMQPKA